MIQKRIIDIDSIKNIIETMCETPDNTILVTTDNGAFVCGIFYSDVHKEWRVYFDNMTSRLEIDEHLVHILKYYDTLNFIRLKDKESLRYEIRSHIHLSVIDSLMNNETQFHSLIETTMNLLRKPVKVLSGKCGILIGLSATLDDYYYTIMKADGSLFFESCVGEIVEVTGDDIPVDLSAFLNDAFLNIPEIILKTRIEHFKNSDEIEVIY